ncbi:MAG: hypothetical protein AAF658_02620, partial [Myxococcota bacterium]
MKRLLIAYAHCNQGGVASVIKHRLPALRAAGWSVQLAFELDAGGLGDWRELEVPVEIYPKGFPDSVARLAAQGDFDVTTVVDHPSAARRIAEAS